MLNRILVLSFMTLCLLGCKKESVDDSNYLQEKVYGTIDSMSLSFPKEYPVNLYTVSHQKKADRDYIKIATSEFFNRDSVATVELHNRKIIAYYSKDFFEIKNQNLEKYKDLEYANETISLYHPRYVIFEVLKNNTFKNIPIEEGVKMDLFNYGDRYIPEPVPTK